MFEYVTQKEGVWNLFLYFLKNFSETRKDLVQQNVSKSVFEWREGDHVLHSSRRQAENLQCMKIQLHMSWIPEGKDDLNTYVDSVIYNQHC